MVLAQLTHRLMSVPKAEVCVSAKDAEKVVYPPQLRTRRGFILRICVVPTCLLIPFFVWILADQGAPTWILIASVPAVLAMAVIIGFIFWAIVGPAISAGKPFIFGTHPNAPKAPFEKK